MPVLLAVGYGSPGSATAGPTGAPKRLEAELVRAQEPEKKLKARSANEAKPAQGPRNPKLKAAYAYDLHSHCGIRYAKFGGRWWSISAIRTDTRSRVEGLGKAGFNYTAGYMTLFSKNMAVFESAAFPPIQFTPASSKDVPPCE
ncbi:hypothetical protein AB0M44_44610 [Streptosporangium subroseum]|uniref:hypothetical protein n=1 Tax=Streptosporangium subroseum TaxID=106412 RepID=UPI00343753BA